MTDRRREPNRPTNLTSSHVSRPPQLDSSPGELIDRMQQLRALLPAFAQEAAAARREAARLRSHNATLQRRVVELETRFAIARDIRSRDA
jgi:hypothetical protein